MPTSDDAPSQPAPDALAPDALAPDALPSAPPTVPLDALATATRTGLGGTPGSPWSPRAPRMDVPVDEHGRLATDLLCVQCAYNLRTIKRDGQCPECGLEVDATVRAGQLALADAAWLNHLKTGSLVVGIGAVASVIAGIFALAVVWVGLWMVAKPESPATMPASADRRPGWYLRASVILGAIGVGGYIMGFVAMFVLNDNVGAVVLGGGVFCLVASQVFMMIAFPIHIRRLARRMPSVAIEGSATWLLRITVVGLIVGGIAAASFAAMFIDPVFQWGGIAIGIIGGIAYLVASVWFAVLAFQAFAGLGKVTNAQRMGVYV